MAAAATFETLAKHITKEIVEEVDAVYRFDVKTESGVKSWLVDLKNGSGSIKDVSGSDEKGDCAIQMNEGDFVKLFKGELDGQTAFMGGQLKIKGDMMLAMKLESLTEAIPKDIKSKL